jgi:phosphatidylglycerol---prolipoprotein diacylglyceryl transferase
MLAHNFFELLASICSMAMTVFVYRWRLGSAMAKIENAGFGYAFALLLGAALGGYGFGTLNLWLTHVPGIGRSIVGALAGGIAGIEIYKAWRGMKGSTGIVFVPAFATTVVVGRWGCYYAGLADETYGTPTNLPWAVDLGDGILRHPVPLYESFSMLLFLAVALILLARRNAWFMASGFYVMVSFYATQRFAWEFLKPYATVLGPFNLFHLVCAALACYALIMVRGNYERAHS